MSGTDHRDNRRVPVALRIKLRFRNVDTFISKFATNISSTGMFISSRKPREAGTQLRFELRLADDSTIIAGKGRVVWVREYDADKPKEPHGMGIEFVSLNKGSRELIAKIVDQRIHQGLGEHESIPHTLERAEAAVSVPEIPAPRSEQSKQAPPAPSTGVVELSLDDLDSSNIDLASVLRRARELVGTGSADSELDQLFRVSAAPIAETVDDASNKLAQILGGKAVYGRRNRHRDPPTDHAALADLVAAERPTVEPAPSEEPLTVIEDEVQTSVETAALSPEEALPAIEDDVGDFTDPGSQPTAVNAGLSAALALDDALAALDEVTGAPPDDPSQTLDTALAGLEFEDADEFDEARAETEATPSEFDASRAETDESPLIISDESIDELAEELDIGPLPDEDLELDMLEDDGNPRGRAITSAPSGIDVGVLDPGGLEDNGIYELSKPGTGPMDLLKLADLPTTRSHDDDEEYDSDIEFDLPD